MSGGLGGNHLGVEPKIGGKPQNGWFIRETPIKMDDLGGFPYFWKHPSLIFVGMVLHLMNVNQLDTS